MSEKTIFQKIIDREIPADIVYEDDHVIAFLDISPVTKGHTLLVTKQSYTWMTDTPDSEISTIFITAKKLMLAMKHGIGCDYVQLSIVGKDVPHFHIHLIPRFITPDGSDVPPEMRHHEPYETSDEKLSYVEKIKSAL